MKHFVALSFLAILLLTPCSSYKTTDTEGKSILAEAEGGRTFSDITIDGPGEISPGKATCL